MFTTRHVTSVGEHRVELEVDNKLLVVNRAKLFVDGAEVDSADVFYGERDLTAPLPDGSQVVIRFQSGLSGELTRAQVQRGEGRWEDLVEAS